MVLDIKTRENEEVRNFVKSSLPGKEVYCNSLKSMTMLFELIDGRELHIACLCLLLPQLPYHTWLSWSPHLSC